MKDRPRWSVVWWGGQRQAWLFGFHRWDGSLAAIYAWSFGLGPLEVRRWAR